MIRDIVEHGSRPAPASVAGAAPACRFCGAPLEHLFVDLGMSPLCESYLDADQLNQMEPFYPLRVYVCDDCFLVQLEEYVSPTSIFSDYAYFSSYSTSWLKHAEAYAAAIARRLGLRPGHRVIELGSNDGYLLQYFRKLELEVLGVEPAANIAAVANERGIPTRVAFFGEETARQLVDDGWKADLLIANNVLAQVPDLNGFIRGMKLLLAADGVITIEVPHLVRLVERNQFDTIYHEHFSYFSLMALERIVSAHGLTVCDVEELPTHGGSLRIHVRHAERRPHVAARVGVVRAAEMRAGVNRLDYYGGFRPRVEHTKHMLLRFLIEAKQRGQSICGYGAPGKGNTLLNYCGIRTDFIEYTVDLNPRKQGKFLPGTHIPIREPDAIRETQPNFLLVMPWNLKEEIRAQMDYVTSWRGRFVVAIPELCVYS